VIALEGLFSSVYMAEINKDFEPLSAYATSNHEKMTKLVVHKVVH